MLDLGFSFTGKCWMWQGKGTWHFITLPQDKSEEIKFFSENMQGKRRGWGAVRVQVTIGNTAWETSIFPHTKVDAYIFPIKMDVRKKEKIAAEDIVKVTLKINL